MAIVEALGLLQGVGMLQTNQVGQQATGFGSRTKWNRAVAGTPIWVNQATGALLAGLARNAQAQAALGSAQLPFASLEEALQVLSEPANAETFATPRPIYLADGEYTVGAQVIRRPLIFVLSNNAVITDTVMVESSNAISQGSTASVDVQFICPTGVTIRRQCLPAGIEVNRDGVATRAVNLVLQGINVTSVTVGTGVVGSLVLDHAGAEVHAPAIAFALGLRSATLEGAAAEASLIEAFDSFIEPTAITCLGTNECTLYSTRFDANGTWTGGTLLVDPATRYWFLDAHTWVKANPGGTAAVVMD